MAFLKQCAGEVQITVCAVCGNNAVMKVEDSWYCQDCISHLQEPSSTEQ